MLSDKHDTFCQEFVKDLNATQAAVRAGYSSRTARQQGSRLLTNADIQARINELQAEIRKRNHIDADNIMAKLENVYQGAFETKRYSAANRAAELQGKLAGLFKDRSDVALRGTFCSGVSDEELDHEIKRLLKILELSSGRPAPIGTNSNRENE